MPSTSTTVSPMLRRLLLGTSSALLLGSLLTGCASTQKMSVVPAELAPMAAADPAPAGQLVSHPDSVYVRFRFMRVAPKELVFEAEFSNAAAHPITIDPARFYYQPRPDSAAGRRFAFNPETRLDSLARRRDELAYKASRVGLAEILFAVATTAEAVASSGQRDTPIQRTSRQVRQQGGAAFFEVQRVVRAMQAGKLHLTVDELAASSLRRATLQPGDRAVGLVCFPLPATPGPQRFVLLFDEQPVQFEFDQELRKSKPN